MAPHAGHDEIRRAYRAMAQRHHPDANPDRPEDARVAMAQINAAWEVLGDPEKRRAYDWAIGTTPRPAGWEDRGSPGAADDGGEDSVDSDLGSDQPYAAVERRPSDLLVVVPVFMAVAAVAIFVFSTMSESTVLRTLAILMAPVTVGAFVAAPLFVMLRARGRRER